MMHNKKGFTQEVGIEMGSMHLKGELFIPENAKGIVVFAHGSGSSRFSPRNQFVAHFLQQKHLATLLIDLLTIEEEQVDQITRALRFDIELLANRLIEISQWLSENLMTKDLKIGYFGSSTGGAAALIAAARHPKNIAAVVSRGGRPDLAETFLTQVQEPTLLIVGENDELVFKLNQKAYHLLNCIKAFKIVPRATHLFKESGALELVAEWAGEWFLKYLSE